MIKFSTHFLRFDFADSSISDYRKLIREWVTNEDSHFVNQLIEKISHYEEKTGRNIIITNPRTSLILFEKIINNKIERKLILDSKELNILLLKIYLSYNSLATKRERKVLETTADIDPTFALTAKLLCQSLAIFDIYNINLKEVFVSEIIKALVFFRLLDRNKEFQPLLNSFCTFYDVKEYKEYFKRLLSICIPIFHFTSDKGAIDIVLKKGEEDYEYRKRFIELFMLQDTYLDEGRDFLQIRNNPFIKIGEDTYRIIYPLFVLEKIFKSLYFLFRDLNKKLPKKDMIKSIRGIFTYDFSEKIFLYELLERSYPKRFIKISGEKMRINKIEGGIDYYIRNGNKVFLFESKDILINADIKDSYDYNRIYKELHKKLYFEKDTNGKIRKEAVKQLSNFIEIILNKDFPLDDNYKINSIKIYPIIVLHDRQLEITGINRLVNRWFRHELEKIKEKGHEISKIKDVTIINSSTFLLYYEQLYQNKFRLEDVIDEYIEFCDPHLINDKKFKKSNEISDFILNQHRSFSMFITDKINWKLPKIFDEEGLNIFN